MNKEIETKEVDFEAMAIQYDLTEMQTKFAFYYIFVTGLNGREAAELAGYSCGRAGSGTYDNDKAGEYYATLWYKDKARQLLDNPKVLTLITKLRDELGKQLIVDKLYVLQNLKRLAEKGSESIQLRALEKLGETMEMFGQKTIVESREDPAKIAAEKFEKRKVEANVVPFVKDN